MPKDTDRNGPGKGQPTLAPLISGGNIVPCCYCQQQNHPSEACKRVTSVEVRRQTLKEVGRCYICLWKGHISRDCRSNIRCSKCKGRHHVSICYKINTKAGDQQPPPDYHWC